MKTPFLLAALLLAVTLAGCTGGDDGGQDPTDTSTPGTTTGPGGTPTGTSTGTTTSTTTTGSTGSRDDEADVASFSADGTSGEAPLEVTFSLDGSASEDDATWTIAFGDGSFEDGDVADLPQDVVHTYSISGTFVARATITSGDAQASSENITIEVAAAPEGEPPQLVFEYGPAAGCAWDVTGEPCVSEIGGPDAPPIDGFWQPLDDRYWGMVFSSTVTRGGQTGSDGGSWPLYDTDCFFYGEDLAAGRIGEANNGGAACGTADGVPDGTAWLFIAPYGTPAEAMTVTFGVAPEAE